MDTNDAVVDPKLPVKRLPPFYFMVALVVLIGLHVLAPVTRLIPTPWNWLGMIPLWVSLALVMSADRIFKRVGTTVKPFARSSALVVSGPYRLTRNPMYVSMLLGLLGASILAGTLTPFCTIPALGVLLYYRFIRHEERMLRESFGEEYEAYRRRVRRWI